MKSAVVAFSLLMGSLYVNACPDFSGTYTLREGTEKCGLQDDGRDACPLNAATDGQYVVTQISCDQIQFEATQSPPMSSFKPSYDLRFAGDNLAKSRYAAGYSYLYIYLETDGSLRVHNSFDYSQIYHVDPYNSVYPNKFKYEAVLDRVNK